ncbi:single-stranded DNA-binding protein [Lentzea tibetensis]|uniref:Single-stranded DNA-binding protein n=1 Tax=Lentzea tibetensis TaxID=2591470 RepID=A0A563EVI2_9PSEU|nr:single-stranded DNA-binding protein [Lentzea tibetensis]TWP51710.1 single-stranded DNA-binding protein [Lentzea tibetensis]
MAGLPEVTVAGTLTADPELRFTQSGIPVANFTVAANDRKFDQQSGQWVDGDATFLRCTLWRQPAENLAESLRKGNRVLVTGTLRQRSYEVDGQKRTAMELDVTEVGPSLRWATAKVVKATRTTATTGASPAADAWNTTPAATGSGFAEEPPF